MTAPDAHPPGGNPSPALSRLLDATATALQAIRAGQSGTAALDAVDGALRPAVQACHIDRAVRKNPQPSDHAPVVLTLA